MKIWREIKNRHLRWLTAVGGGGRLAEPNCNAKTVRTDNRSYFENDSSTVKLVTESV